MKVLDLFCGAGGASMVNIYDSKGNKIGTTNVQDVTHARYDLILARRVWTIIYLPLLVFSTWFALSSLFNLQSDWWHIPLGCLGVFWSYISLHFIWVDA